MTPFFSMRAKRVSMLLILLGGLAFSALAFPQSGSPRSEVVDGTSGEVADGTSGRGAKRSEGYAVSRRLNHFVVTGLPMDAPTQGFIKSVTYDGTSRDDPLSHDSNGCPEGSAVIKMSKNRSTFNVSFGPQLAIAFGPVNGLPTNPPDGPYRLGWPEVIEDRSCDLQVNINSPPGWSYSIKSAVFEGLVNTTEGLNTGLDGYYQFNNPSGNDTMAVEPYHWNGVRYQGKYSLNHADISDLGVGWSKCGGMDTFDISAQVALRNNTASANTVGFISITGIKDVIIDWKQC